MLEASCETVGSGGDWAVGEHRPPWLSAVLPQPVLLCRNVDVVLSGFLMFPDKLQVCILHKISLVLSYQ